MSKQQKHQEPKVEMQKTVNEMKIQELADIIQEHKNEDLEQQNIKRQCVKCKEIRIEALKSKQHHAEINYYLNLNKLAFKKDETVKKCNEMVEQIKCFKTNVTLKLIKLLDTQESFKHKNDKLQRELYELSQSKRKRSQYKN